MGEFFEMKLCTLDLFDVRPAQLACAVDHGDCVILLIGSDGGTIKIQDLTFFALRVLDDCPLSLRFIFVSKCFFIKSPEIFISPQQP